MDHIDAHLTTATQNTRYSIAIRAALEIGNKTFNRYYNKTDYSEVYRIAMGKFISQVTIGTTNANTSARIDSPKCCHSELGASECTIWDVRLRAHPSSFLVHSLSVNASIACVYYLHRR